ncbi:hypothetical protein [Bifidobacterium olomucense]|uniref:Transmembrane Fragile-X-F protein n=1 Tax=Bifidobacterium olomucense TaxID=2675324 RepID=A0A7Y0HXK7_9BIFI|nr:hypothetical protein [Bifidobacterium sp. DSM 109959]NMM98119.1 hypothetical protein [Bifidobacterium sp. DSM 109959]
MNVKIDFGGFNLLCMLLGVLFLGLKLAHVIEWSWWLVLLPLYLPFVVFLVAVAALFILHLFKDRSNQ